MQVPNSREVDPKSPTNPEKSKATESTASLAEGSNTNEKNSNSSDGSRNSGRDADDESVIDVSGQNVEFSLSENTEASVEGIYMYRNVFNLIPKSVGGLCRLRTLKFFGNEISLFPAELGNLLGLECLQVKISSLDFSNDLSLAKLKGLKELELTKVPRRPSVLTMLSEIAGLKCLTKLSVCHFSIRYLPPEIGCLKSLEFLDLSFNKLKSLPKEISYLNSLISLKVANNKLVELPSSLSSLQRLENLDLSNNRLTSLGSLELGVMHNLQYLNLQYNKLLNYCQIPSWICCNLEENGNNLSNEDFTSSSVEMDVYETSIQESNGSVPYIGSHHSSSSMSSGPSSNNRCFSAWRSSKRWKRQQHYLQQRARQERLNNSRKWKGEGLAEGLNVKADQIDRQCNKGPPTAETSAEGESDIVGLDNDDDDDDDDDDKQLYPVDFEGENSAISVEEEKVSSKKTSYAEDCQCVNLESINKGGENECCEGEACLASLLDGAGGKDNGSSSEISKATPKSKRHSDSDLDNPKPCKYRKPTGNNSRISHKYSSTSFCSIEDRLPDGFYDAGRDRPFMPLRSCEQFLHLDSREVILVDRERDEELDAITLSAQALVFQLKQLNCLAKDRDQALVDSLPIASLLALFVSDHFGGSDRGAIVERTRKAVSGSNYKKPFVCTCSTGNSNSISKSTKHISDSLEDIIFADLCEKSLRSIKLKNNSIVVPLGALQFGVCRHRALLMKYLCDRMEPPIPCELVRGYLDFLPHAWNIIPIKRGDLWVRMVVDACRPHDIREESDPEYFCRYIPLTRVNMSISDRSNLGPGCSFPSLSTCDETEKAASNSLIQCKFGSVEAVAKVRTLEVCGTSMEQIRNFEYSCLGEVRMLGALKHSCIVELYGHQISSKWIPAVDGSLDHRVICSAILMEYVHGGSLKSHIEKLSKAGKKRVPVELAMWIARDIAAALAELHSKHIIHRDIKSENILIDLDQKRADGTPFVKLCDFDRAVPLRSFLHTCCIAHIGIPPPDVCVGTPRWMAPEVLRAMHKRCRYGLEVDIWSYGCLLFELLTLQVPYSGLSESNIHELLQMGKRPPLTDELEALGSSDKHSEIQFGTELDLPQADLESLRFLVDVFHRCTEANPTDRPSAGDLYEMLVAHTNNFIPLRN